MSSATAESQRSFWLRCDSAVAEDILVFHQYLFVGVHVRVEIMDPEDVLNPDDEARMRRGVCARVGT